MNDQSITRRESIQRIVQLSFGAVLAGGIGNSFIPSTVFGKTEKSGWLVEGVGESTGYSIKELTSKVLDAAGGMGRFVSPGDVVVIKPNISWARAPQLAATTNPEVLEAVIELCREAGAKKVRIADNTIHDARRCFSVTGVGKVAEKTGADLVYPRSSMMKEMNLHGRRLTDWPVFTPLVEADKVINLPVAKVHALCELTLGMKNWIGGVGGRRSALHQDIDESIVDLAQFFKPAITLIDATRIMVANGPSGGSESDVRAANRLILSNDQVAADAKAALLFGMKPEDVGFIRLGNKRELGVSDLNLIKQIRVSL